MLADAVVPRTRPSVRLDGSYDGNHGVASIRHRDHSGGARSRRARCSAMAASRGVPLFLADQSEFLPEEVGIAARSAPNGTPRETRRRTSPDLSLTSREG
jgi:hypothetical protein